MIRLLSYIYPITKTIKSKYSGTLEITWYNGKKHLDTKNANYSYGSLQKILKIGLQKIDLTNVQNILVLGMGGGSAIKTLLTDFKYENYITALDIDPVIIEIAKTEFNISETENLKIICGDAINFVDTTKKKYDLIIIDLFIDRQVPNDFYKDSFLQNITKLCSKNGQILFNADLSNAKKKNISEVVTFFRSKSFQVEKYDKVNGTNTLLIARNTT